MYYAVIMAGGSGTRLWPLSRRHFPKQALRFIGERTMFQYAVERILPVFPPERIFIVTLAEYASILKKQMPCLPPGNFILEPEGRGTASAIGLAAIHLAKRDPEACMAILTADHFITQSERLCQVLSASETVAANGSLVTLGIQPKSPSIGFGYIHHGPLIGNVNSFPVFEVERFIEKPDLAAAKQMVESGDYSWNSGMFIWQANRILQEFESQMPDFYSQLMEIDTALDSPEYSSVLGRIWPRIVKTTIDYGIMEGAHKVVVIPVDLGWTDIGSWGSLFGILSSDTDNNVFIGQHLNIDSKGTLVYGGKRLVAVMGVKDLVIVDTDDVLMVCSRDREQDVKSLVELLKKTHREDLI